MEQTTYASFSNIDDVNLLWQGNKCYLKRSSLYSLVTALGLDLLFVSGVEFRGNALLFCIRVYVCVSLKGLSNASGFDVLLPDVVSLGKFFW